jgi:hypothetical protein
MRKATLSFIGFLIGIISFIFVPYGFKFIGFIIPLIILCYIFSSEDDYFNINLFLVFLFIFLLIPSSFMTFDAGTPVNWNKMNDTVFDLVDSIAIIVMVIIPIFLILGIIWAFYQGEVVQASRALLILIVTIGFVISFFSILDLAGIELYGSTGFVMDFYISLIEFIVTLPQEIYNAMDTALETLGIGDFPDIPEKKVDRATNFNVYYNNFSTMDYHTTIFTIHNLLPLFVSLLCLLTTIFTLSKKGEDQLQEWLNKVSEPIYQKRVSLDRQYFPNLNWKMLVFATILIISAFAIFLSYSSAYNLDPDNDAQYIGFFSVYLFMSIIPLVIMNLSGFTYYKDSNAFNTIKGTVYGVFGLFLMTRLFFTVQVMNAYNTQDHRSDTSYIINTFVFVAPSESIMFHIFIPSLVAGIILAYSKRNIRRGYELSREERLLELDLKIFSLQEIQKSLKLKQKEKARLTQDITKLEKQKQSLLREQVEQILVDERTIFGRRSSIIIFIIFGVIIPNFIFATLHAIVPNIDFFTFWTSGLGIIFLAGGCWMTFISYRFGWLAGILTHAIYNTFTIILAIIVLGG